MTLTYRRTDHTADFGMEIYGQSSAGLFENAALALFDQIVDPAGVKGVQEENLTINGTDWPDLMVNWLRELLFFWNGKELLVKKAEILSITGTRLSARISYAPYDPGQHTIINEIKAVTYHQIRVEEGPYGWKATVIFDV
jgi:SHS2 domain-containing protein